MSKESRKQTVDGLSGCFMYSVLERRLSKKQYWWDGKPSKKAEMVVQNSLSAKHLPTSDDKHLSLPEQVYFHQPLVMGTC